MGRFEHQFKNKADEVFFIEPNNLGFNFLTNFYKRITANLKSMPFIIIFPLSLVSAIFLYFIFKQLLIRLVSLLQYGF